MNRYSTNIQMFQYLCNEPAKPSPGTSSSNDDEDFDDDRPRRPLPEEYLGMMDKVGWPPLHVSPLPNAHGQLPHCNGRRD